MASTSVVKTKLYPPVSRSSLVERSRLLDLLAENKSRKLTLVAAPAGFGKTTMLGQWFDKLQEEGENSGWCSLDQEDNNAARFLRHVIGALRNCADVGIDIIRQLDTTLVSDITDTLPTLINDLSDSQKDITLFIDDFHYITSEQINQFIELLINLSPGNFHLVISGRIRPSLSLSSLRVRNELCEITANHLRFDTGEAKDFMYDVIGLDLSPEHLNSLYEHSEGWAAGLQLASLSLHDPSRRDKFIATFSGSLRGIADYLASDVLNQQAQGIRDFLLRTSILERLSADACNALTRSQNGRDLLEKIESSNLFLVPLDETGEWYRYHHLFQEFLRTQLRRVYPEEIVSLYKNASDWFATTGYINEAVNYALLAGDMNKVGHLVHTGTMETMAMEGRMAELLSWVSSIPQSVKTKFPRLLMQECIALSHLCRPVEAIDVAEQAQVSIQQLGTIHDYEYSEAELTQIHSEQSILPFMIAFCQDDIEGIAGKVQQALNTSDDLILGMAHNFLGYAYIGHGRLDDAYEELTKARFHHVKKGTYYGAVFSDCFMAIVYLHQYRLHDALEHACAAEQLVKNIEGGHIPGMAKAKVMQAVVYYEWNRIDEATELLETWLPMIEDAGQVTITQYGFLSLARCYAAKRKFELAVKTLNKCSLLSQHTNTDYINLMIELEKLRYAHSGGYTDPTALNHDYQQIRALVDYLEKQWDRVKFVRLLLLVHSSIYTGEHEIFEQNFQRILRLSREKSLIVFNVQLLLLSVMVDIRAEKIDAACRSLSEVIDIASPQNGIRVIVDAGANIQAALDPLKKKLLADGDPGKSEFIRKLQTLIAFHCESRHEKEKISGNNDIEPLIETLSTREIEILELLATGNSNSAISGNLLISENTVKWHIKNVFAKLGVNNRTAAVVLAQQHGFIS